MQAAGALAALTSASLHVLHAFDFESVPYRTESHHPLTFQVRIAEARQALDEQIERTVDSGVAVASREIVIYVAFKAIRERARIVKADVIVLGRHRRGRILDVFLGGTADRVIRSADVPCLIVHEPVSLPLRRVVVPVDLSTPGSKALDAALTWTALLGAHDTGAELVVLHVIPQVFDFADVPLGRAPIGPELKRQVEAASARVGPDPRTTVREEVRWADAPGDEILRFIQEEKAELAVLGTHGHGAFRRALIGSVAARVARSASCPVLLVPPTDLSLD